MALTASEIVVLRRPALRNDARLDDMTTLAETMLSEDVYGDHYAQAVALLILHLYAMSDRGGSAGVITSETEGALSRSYQVSGLEGQNTQWSATSWGQELINLTQMITFSPRNRMMT